MGGASTESSLSNFDAMVGQCSSFRQAGLSKNPVGVAGNDMPPLEELTAAEKFSERSRYYPSQSANTLLKEFFELNPPQF